MTLQECFFSEAQASDLNCCRQTAAVLMCQTPLAMLQPCPRISNTARHLKHLPPLSSSHQALVAPQAECYVLGIRQCTCWHRREVASLGQPQLGHQLQGPLSGCSKAQPALKLGSQSLEHAGCGCLVRHQHCTGT